MRRIQQESRSYFAIILGLLLLLGLFAAAGRAIAVPAPSRSVNTGDVVAACSPIARVATFNPMKDNTLFDSLSGDKSNGKGQYLFAGKTAEVTNFRRRALIAFDISKNSLRSATVLSATLDLHMSKTIVGDRTVSLHKVLANWGEGTSDALGQEGEGASATTGDATWLHTFYNTGMWSTAGGDFVQTTTATQTVGSEGFYTWGSTSGMVEDVQDWFRDPEKNYGWIVVGNEETVSAKRFDSRENSKLANRPVLTVWYSYVDCNFLPMILK